MILPRKSGHIEKSVFGGVSMGAKRRSFTKEFKLEAVRLVIEEGNSIVQASRGLGIRPALLGRWK
jgi:transposase